MPLVALAYALLALAPAAESDVRETVMACNKAYAANELAAYFACYASDLTQWWPEGRVDLAKYDKDWHKFVADGGRVKSADVSDLVVQVAPAGDAAVASYQLRVVTQQVDGKVTTDIAHETDVLCQSAPSVAADWHGKVRRALSSYLGRGYAAADFVPAEEGGRRRPMYVLAKRTSSA